MIDIHSHILPGIDDGAADMYDMLEMASVALEGGVREIVATPHCNIPGMFDNYYNREYIELFRKTEEALNRERLPLKLYSGMEVFVTPDIPRLLTEGKILTINGGHNLLVEFSFDEDPEYVQRMLGEIYDLGIRPVIAHAERYEFVQDDLQMVYHWRKKGYYVQINKGSVLGRFGRHAEYAARHMLNHHLVSAIASDAHGPFHRTPYMRDAYEELLIEYPETYLRLLFEENPRRICQDRETVRLELRTFEEEEW